MIGFVGEIIGALLGARDNGIDWDAKARSDEQRARRAKQAQAYANGWRPWTEQFPSGQWRTPYSYERVWIWRLDWEFPSDVDPKRLDPAMNVMGLLWKPWRPSEVPSLDKPA